MRLGATVVAVLWRSEMDAGCSQQVIDESCEWRSSI